MKTINTITQKLTLITGIIMGALILTTTVANAEPKNNHKKEAKKVVKKEIATAEAEILVQMEQAENLMDEFKALNVPTIKIFDTKDNLIYEGVVDNVDAIKDRKILSLIHKSDFLMSLENTSYYKLNE